MKMKKKQSEKKDIRKIKANQVRLAENNGGVSVMSLDGFSSSEIAELLISRIDFANNIHIFTSDN